MTTVDYTGLSLAGALSIERLTALELHVGVNEHGWAVVEGEAGKDALEQLQGAVAGREQVILVQDETGAEQPLFSGIIRTAGLITYGGYNRFHIELQSGTILMDQVKRSRSFQEVGQTTARWPSGWRLGTRTVPLSPRWGRVDRHPDSNVPTFLLR